MGLYLYNFQYFDSSRTYDGVSGKVGLIKELRGLFGLGLKEAKDIADDLENGSTQRELTTLVTHEGADKLRNQFGVDVRIIKAIEFVNVADMIIPTVFVVKKNSDTTEGRGPMIVDCIFSNRAAAEEYIDDKPGIMGRKAKWSQEKYGDWTIEEMPLYSLAAQKDEAVIAEQRAKALAKLTPFERKILGLE